MIVFTGTPAEIASRGKALGLLNGYPDVGDSSHTHVLEGCYSPKKGQYFLRPSGDKGIVQLEIAENDHQKNNYPIVHPDIGESFRSEHTP